MKKIVLFRGELDTINLFSSQLKKGFLELGEYEIFEVDLQDFQRSFKELYNFMQGEPVTAMVGFNSAFFGMKLPSGGNMCEQLQIPCVNILVDHPYWYPEILEQMPQNGIVLCVDKRHMNYVNRFYTNISMNGFLPHGGTPMKRNPKPVANRKCDVLYAGSLYADYVALQKPDFSVFDFEAEQICEETIELLIQHPEYSIEYVLENTLKKHDVFMNDHMLSQFISSCVYIERIVSSYYREKILATVANAGISLDLYGSGWEKCDWIKLSNVNYHGMVSPHIVLEKMEDAKIVLNTMPWFKEGSHERVFNGMLRGAVVCSEKSTYLEETLPSDTWLKFDLSESSLGNLPTKIKTLLEDEEKMQEIATAGYRLAASRHTWQIRAKELHEDLFSLF